MTLRRHRGCNCKNPLVGIAAAIILGAVGATPTASASTESTAAPEASQPTTVELAAHVKLHAAPGTVFRRLPDQRLSLNGRGGTRTHVVVLHSGRIDALVDDESGKQAVLVVVPRKSSAICTRGRTAVVADGATTAIASLSGETLVMDVGAPRPMAERTVRTWEGRTGQAQDRAVMQAPVLQAGPRAWVDLGQGANLSDVRWTDIPGASAYEIAVRSADTRELIATKRTTTPEADGALRLPAGRYELAVRAFDALGFEGSMSASTPIRVVGFRLEDGAFVDGRGVVRVGTEQRIHATFADGLAITYGGGGNFLRSDGEVGLVGGRGVSVWFRSQGQPRPEAVARIEPRTLSTQIEIGPKRAAWPGEPLFISIRLVDADGAPADGVQVIPRAMLGTKILDVEWKEAGSTLYTVVPAPPEEPGPWVVRVETHDQYGVALGRAFLEVADGRSAE